MSHGLYRLRNLEHFDISENKFTGHIDVLLFPALRFVDFSKNKFTTAGFRRFHKAFYTLQKVNLSSNLISQDASELFLNIPPTLESFDLSNNDIRGTLPQELSMKQLLIFVMSNNSISGPLPDFPDTSPKLKQLVLAKNQLTGTIHDSFFKLNDLNVLDLTGNELIGGIPAGLGDLTQLNTLKLASNSLSKSIPVKLGRLKGRWSYRCTCIKCVCVSNINLTRFVSKWYIYFHTVQTCQKHLTCLGTHLLEPSHQS